MLIDIFARRYSRTLIRDSFEQRDGRLLVQAFRILAEDIYPYYQRDGNESERGVKFWTNLHKRLSRELGVQELSKQFISYTAKWNGNDVPKTYKYPMVKVCENWLNQSVSGSPDEHIKERLSLIELGFRERENEIAVMNAQPVTAAEKTFAALSHSTLRVPGDRDAGVRWWRATQTDLFRSSVEELNVRFRQAGYPLNYHNGFIQITSDDLLQREVEDPFWKLVAASEWGNVDQYMKEALDLRDSGGPDPAFYAARALESTIKIISDRKGWTQGKENGSHNYINNLSSKTNKFIDQWEAECLKHFFSNVRNPLGHGVGDASRPTLSRIQTEWAIEFCMSWIKNLIRRL